MSTLTRGRSADGERRTPTPRDEEDMSEARVLVVDDEKSMRDLLAITLQKAGYDVTLAEGGAAAIEAIRRDPFDAIITDLRMPKVDGLQVLRAAKEQSPDTAVIMVTAMASTETAVEAMKLGAYDYITKPFKLDEVNLIIKNALERKHLPRREPVPPQAAGDPAPLREHHRQELPDGGGLRHDPEDRGQPLDRHDHRRERHRQGAGGPRDPLQQPPPQTSRSCR